MHSAEFPFLSALDRACESRLSCLPVCSKGKGGKEGICWASFLVLRSGSTMPRHDLADFLCAFGQANYRLYAAYQWTDDVEQRRCIATTCSSSRASSPLSGVCAWCTAGGHAPFGLLLPERSLDPATPIFKPICSHLDVRQLGCLLRVPDAATLHASSEGPTRTHPRAWACPASRVDAGWPACS